jgi:hypothetical protein
MDQPWTWQIYCGIWSSFQNPYLIWAHFTTVNQTWWQAHQGLTTMVLDAFPKSVPNLENLFKLIIYMVRPCIFWQS